MGPVADHTLRVIRFLRIPADIALRLRGPWVINQYWLIHSDDGGKGLRLLAGLECGYI